MDITYTDDKGVIHSVSLEEFEKLNNNKMERILGYDEDGCPMYALSTKQTIVTYVLLAVGLMLFSGVVVWMLS